MKTLPLFVLRNVLVMVMGLALGAVSPANAAQTVQVAISHGAFSPHDITVAKGTTVVWTNHDPANHGVTADQPQFESPALGAGESFSWTFGEEGSFSYTCSQHSQMTGTVTVTGK